MHIFFIISALTTRIFANSMSNVFQKKLVCEGNSSACISYINYLILSIFFLPFLFQINFNILSCTFWIYSLVGGIMGALANYYIIMALKSGELSILGPINSYKVIVSLIFGMIILKEYPNFYGLLGIILVIIGSYYIFDTMEEKCTLRVLNRKDIQFRIYALVFAAIEAICIKKVIEESSVFISIIATCILGAIFSFALLKLKKIKLQSEIKCVKHSHIILYLGTAFCFELVLVTSAFVFKYINVAYALSLFQLSILLNVILGYKIFKEKNLVQKLTGTLIILAGSTLIILLGVN